ncbi:MAG: MarR family transcriptional regulator [Burkholderiales bacterium]
MNEDDFHSAAGAGEGARPPSSPCAAFYQAEGFKPEDSIGLPMRQILTSIAQEVQRGMGDEHPTFPQWVPLYKLHLGHANTVAELARGCQLDAGAMTRLLDRLEAKGLCRRVRSASDRRVVHIELTDDGRSAAQQIPAILSRVQNEHLAGFSVQEWRMLQDFLRRILDNVLAIQARSQGN